MIVSLTSDYPRIAAAGFVRYSVVGYSMHIGTNFQTREVWKAWIGQVGRVSQANFAYGACAQCSRIVLQLMSCKRSPLKLLVINSSTVYRVQLASFNFCMLLSLCTIPVSIFFDHLYTGNLTFSVIPLWITNSQWPHCALHSKQCECCYTTRNCHHTAFFHFRSTGCVFICFVLLCVWCGMLDRCTAGHQWHLYCRIYFVMCAIMELCIQRRIAKPIVHDESWLHQCYSVVPHNVLLYLFWLEDFAFCMCSVACLV